MPKDRRLEVINGQSSNDGKLSVTVLLTPPGNSPLKYRGGGGRIEDVPNFTRTGLGIECSPGVLLCEGGLSPLLASYTAVRITVPYRISQHPMECRIQVGAEIKSATLHTEGGHPPFWGLGFGVQVTPYPLPNPRSLSTTRTLSHGGLRPFPQKSTCLAQLTSGTYVVQIWSRGPKKIEATKPSYSTVWYGASLNPAMVVSGR